jgi:hypothetical protein
MVLKSAGCMLPSHGLLTLKIFLTRLWNVKSSEEGFGFEIHTLEKGGI